jgi:hypothetical protein
MSLYSGTDEQGRKMLRIEARNAEVPIERKPPWIKTRMRTGPEYQRIQDLVTGEGLHTVCQEAGCPNIYECWEGLGWVGGRSRGARRGAWRVGCHLRRAKPCVLPAHVELDSRRLQQGGNRVQDSTGPYVPPNSGTPTLPAP